MKFKISQNCDYANGYLRYGHLEGIIETESKEALEKMIKETPDYVRDAMGFKLDDYELNDYDTGDNPIEIVEVVKDEDKRN